MAVNTLGVAPGRTKPRELKVGLSTAEAIRAFTQALVARHPQVIARKPAVPARPQQRGPQAGPASAGRPVVRQVVKPKPKTYPRPALAQPYRAPETELDTALAAMWIELLLIAPIGLDDNFFELGGHSLLALQLLPRMREKYQIMLEPREFFANPTIAKLASLVHDKLVSEISEIARPDKAGFGAETRSMPQ